MRLEFNDERSNKFWSPEVNGNILKVRFGRMGTNGQEHIIGTFSSPEAAMEEYRKRTCEKLVEGYKPSSCISDVLGPAIDSREAGVCWSYVGEHVEEVAKDLCAWLTCCAQNGISTQRFSRLWDKIMEEEDEVLVEALGFTAEDGNWFDELEDIADIGDFYKSAVEGGAIRFVAMDDGNAYVDIVAIAT